MEKVIPSNLAYIGCLCVRNNDTKMLIRHAARTSSSFERNEETGRRVYREGDEGFFAFLESPIGGRKYYDNAEPAQRRPRHLHFFRISEWRQYNDDAGRCWNQHKEEHGFRLVSQIVILNAKEPAILNDFLQSRGILVIL